MNFAKMLNEIQIGQIALCTGGVHVEPDGKNSKERMCFEVTYEDGFKDYAPTSEIDDGSYKFVVQ